MILHTVGRTIIIVRTNGEQSGRANVAPESITKLRRDTNVSSKIGSPATTYGKCRMPIPIRRTPNRGTGSRRVTADYILYVYII